MSFIFKNQLLSTFAARGMAAGGTFLLSYVLATFVDLKEFGAFMLCLSIMIGIQVFTSLGTDRATLKYMGIATANDNRREVKWIYHRGFWVNMAASLVVSTLLFFWAAEIAALLFTNVEKGAHALRITALLSPLYSIIYLCNFILKGWGKANVSCLFEIGSISIILSLFIVGISLFSNVVLTASYLMALLGSLLVLYLVIGLWAVMRVYGSSGLSDDRKISFSRGFYQSLPDFLLVGIIFYYIQWGASVVLGVFHSEEQVAIFSLGLRLAMIIGFILTVYDSILGPKFSRLYHENNHTELRRLAKKSTLQMSLFSALPAFIFLLWPEWILSFFGNDYQGAAGVLRVLVLAQVINVFTGSVVLLLLMVDRQRLARNLLLLSVVVGGGVALILTPFYGAMGAALSLLVCLTVHNVLAVYVVKRDLGFLMMDWRGAYVRH
nr:MATE family efflux transporter [Halomonas dongshanensis]